VDEDSNRLSYSYVTRTDASQVNVLLHLLFLLQVKQLNSVATCPLDDLERYQYPRT